jgi:hypothetical protein
MVRATGPCFSLDARNSMGSAITYSFWRGINYVRARVIPHNPSSTCQSKIRAVLSNGVSKWRFGFISNLNKNWWNTYAKGLGESGFNRYMRSYLEANYASCTIVSPQQNPNPS